MYPNGYVMVDVDSLVWANIAVNDTVAGLYQKLLDAYNTGKPVYLCNVTATNGYIIAPIPCYLRLLADKMQIQPLALASHNIDVNDVVTA